MEKGKVKFFNSEKNFGFINGDNESSYFVHGSQIPEDGITEGDEVEFDTEETDRGLRALNVKKVSKTEE